MKWEGFEDIFEGTADVTGLIYVDPNSKEERWNFVLLHLIFFEEQIEKRAVGGIFFFKYVARVQGSN